MKCALCIVEKLKKLGQFNENFVLCIINLLPEFKQFNFIEY